MHCRASGCRPVLGVRRQMAPCGRPCCLMPMRWMTVLSCSGIRHDAICFAVGGARAKIHAGRRAVDCRKLLLAQLRSKSRLHKQVGLGRVRGVQGRLPERYAAAPRTTSPCPAARPSILPPSRAARRDYLESPCRDLGFQTRVVVHTASSASKGICNLDGKDKLRHVELQCMWLQ